RQLALRRVAQLHVEGNFAAFDVHVLHRLGADEVLSGVRVGHAREPGEQLFLGGHKTLSLWIPCSVAAATKMPGSPWKTPCPSASSSSPPPCPTPTASSTSATSWNTSRPTSGCGTSACRAAWCTSWAPTTRTARRS